MRKAEPGQHWVPVWKTASEQWIRNDDLLTSGLLDDELVVFHTTDESFNPWGFGAYRLHMTKMPARHPSTASDMLFHASGIEFRAKGFTSLLSSIQLKDDVEGATEFEATYLVLEWLRGEKKLAFNKIAQTHDFAEQIFLPSSDLPYGTMFVPKHKSGLLDLLPYDGQLSLTHDLVDTVGTKHRLMAELGFNDAINKDLRRISNALEYAQGRAA